MGKTQFGFIDLLLVMLFVCDTHMLVSDLQNTPFPLTSTMPPDARVYEIVHCHTLSGHFSVTVLSPSSMELS